MKPKREQLRLSVEERSGIPVEFVKHSQARMDDRRFRP